MEISIKHFGGSEITPAAIIELTFKDGNTQFNSDVTDLRKKVDVNLIANLRQIADELEEQNRLVEELLLFNSK